MLGQYIRYAPIIKFIKKNKTKDILEVGSGSQGLGKFMNIKFTGLDKTTDDYSGKKNKTHKNMTFVEGCADNIPFEDGSFDFVFSLDMIEHIPNDKKEQIITEIIRVSNKYVILGFPCGNRANKFDKYRYNLYKNKDKEIPGWLVEHVEIGIPSESQIHNIINNIIEKQNLKKVSFLKNADSNVWSLVSKIGRSYLVYIPFFIKSIVFTLSLFGLDFITTKNNYYRMFIIIEK